MDTRCASRADRVAACSVLPVIEATKHMRADVPHALPVRRSEVRQAADSLDQQMKIGRSTQPEDKQLMSELIDYKLQL